MKTLVMYFSKYGTTKKYAEWIASELNGDVFDIKSINKLMYYSKFGNIKKYAKWIAFELNDNNFDLNNVKQNLFINYDTIIFGSALYAGNIKCIKTLLENYEMFKDKKLILFTCGLADYSKTENIDAIRKRLEKEIPNNIMQTIKVFYLRGGINYKKLNLKHKIMMALLKKIVIKRRLHKANEEDKEFIETYGQTMDFTDKNSINEIIEYCKSNKRIERVPSNCYYKNNIK